MALEWAGFGWINAYTWKRYILLGCIVHIMNSVSNVQTAFGNSTRIGVHWCMGAIARVELNTCESPDHMYCFRVPRLGNWCCIVHKEL